METIVCGIESIHFQQQNNGQALIAKENSAPQSAVVRRTRAATVAAVAGSNNWNKSLNHWPVAPQHQSQASMSALATHDSPMADHFALATAPNGHREPDCEDKQHNCAENRENPDEEEQLFQLNTESSSSVSVVIDGDGVVGVAGVVGAAHARRRSLPARACRTNDSLKKTTRHTIMKKTRKPEKTTNQKTSSILKLYARQTLTNFRPANLETIYEEPSAGSNDDDDHNEAAASPLNSSPSSSSLSDAQSQGPQPELKLHGKRQGNRKGINALQQQVRFVGAKKIRRAITCTDGFHINKSLVKQRRAKVRKTFGRRSALRKIPMEVFIEHFVRTSTNSTDDDDDSDDDHNEEPSTVTDGILPTATMARKTENRCARAGASSSGVLGDVDV